MFRVLIKIYFTAEAMKIDEGCYAIVSAAVLSRDVGNFSIALNNIILLGEDWFT